MATNRLRAALHSANAIRKLLNGGYWPGTGILLLAMLLLWSGCTAPSLCSEAERNVLVEFPLYGGGEVNAEGNVDTGACAVYYEVPDPPDQVQSYFVEQLTEHGWTVEADPSAGSLVEAQRGQLFYVVYYEAIESNPGPGTRLAVHVGQG